MRKMYNLLGLMLVLSGCDQTNSNLPPVPEFPTQAKHQSNLQKYTVDYTLSDRMGKTYQGHILDVTSGVIININQQKSLPYLKKSQVIMPGSGVPDEDYGTLKVGPRLELVILGDAKNSQLQASKVTVTYNYLEVDPDADDGTYFNKFNAGNSKIELPATRNVLHSGSDLISVDQWSNLRMISSDDKHPVLVRLLVKPIQ